MKILEVKDLYKSYPNKTVSINNISLNLNDLDIISIIGPSGCGKSTLLSILAGITKDYKGTYKYYIKNPKISYMLQSDTLLPWLTVYENILLPLKITNTKNDQINELLKKYHLYEFKDKYPDQLSGGMRQRVSLIRALIIKPDILLLDEPLSALDYQTRLNIREDILSMIKAENIPTIIVTHDIEEAIYLSNKVYVLSNRPSNIKNIYDINIPKNNFKDCKLDPLFNEYFIKIWDDLK